MRHEFCVDTYILGGYVYVWCKSFTADSSRTLWIRHFTARCFMYIVCRSYDKLQLSTVQFNINTYTAPVLRANGIERHDQLQAFEYFPLTEYQEQRREGFSNCSSYRCDLFGSERLFIEYLLYTFTTVAVFVFIFGIYNPTAVYIMYLADLSSVRSLWQQTMYYSGNKKSRTDLCSLYLPLYWQDCSGTGVMRKVFHMQSYYRKYSNLWLKRRQYLKSIRKESKEGMKKQSIYKKIPLFYFAHNPYFQDLY